MIGNEVVIKSMREWEATKSLLLEDLASGADSSYEAFGKFRFRYCPAAGDKLSFFYPDADRRMHEATPTLTKSLGLMAVTHSLLVYQGVLTVVTPEIDIHVANPEKAINMVGFFGPNAKPTLTVENLPADLKRPS